MQSWNKSPYAFLEILLNEATQNIFQPEIQTFPKPPALPACLAIASALFSLVLRPLGSFP